jgi:hypothetical protein
MTTPCEYPGCPSDATFDVTCHGEGVQERRILCESHKVSAQNVCDTFGWTLTIKPLATTEH